MPPLKRPESLRYITLPSRTGAVAAQCDVLVVGGGLSGIGAAIGAANSGANVILVEQHGFLGGHATAALVTLFSSYYTNDSAPIRIPSFSLFPTDHGPGHPVIGGVLKRFVERMVNNGGALRPSSKTGFLVPFDPEIFKLTALEMLDDAGVSYLLHSLASGVTGNCRINGVIFETKSGPIIINARAVVDCTGDGDIAFFAGAPYKFGRPEDGLVQPMTLVFRLAQFNKAVFKDYVKHNPDQWHGVLGLKALVQEATDKGDLHLPREDILMFGTPHDEEVLLDTTRIIKVSGTDVWDLTYAEWEGRRQMRMIAEFLRRYVPGFADSYISESGSAVGVRETRRIVGEYEITADDLINTRHFEDVIALGAYPLDIHNPQGKGTILKRIPPGKAYEIPLRSLIPLDVEGLITAGRCISGTHEAMSAYRVMSISMATGQAAGVCAAHSARSGIAIRKVPYQVIQKELLKQGAILRNEAGAK